MCTHNVRSVAIHALLGGKFSVRDFSKLLFKGVNSIGKGPKSSFFCRPLLERDIDPTAYRIRATAGHRIIRGFQEMRVYGDR